MGAAQWGGVRSTCKYTQILGVKLLKLCQLSQWCLNHKLKMLSVEHTGFYNQVGAAREYS